MLDQTSTEKLHKVVALNNTGQTEAASTLCREILAQHPDHVTTLLWLAYSSMDEKEIFQAIKRAHQIEPNNPAVLEALNLYNSQLGGSTPQPEQAQPTVPSPSTPLPEAAAPSQSRNYLAAGDPVKDGSNFIMTQTGGLFIMAVLAFLGSIGGLFFASGLMQWLLDGESEIFRFRWNGLTIGSAISILIFGGLSIYFFIDVIKPPVKAYGQVKGRKKEFRQRKNDYGQVSDMESFWEYYVDFIPDGEFHSVRLTLTEDQFMASDRAKYAYVEYSKQSGNCRLYQPMK
jgi:hypothetical protein